MGQKLLNRVNSVARLKHFSFRTEKLYRYFIKQFILLHNKRHPAEISDEHIRASRLPVVLSKHEVGALMDGAGLRLMETLRL